jgi:hypothetical protein
MHELKPPERGWRYIYVYDNRSMPQKSTTQKQREEDRKRQLRQDQRGFRYRDHELERLLNQNSKARRHYRKYGSLPPAIAAYFDSLEHPERALMIKVPLQINNVYSSNTITARTMCVKSVSVTGGGSVELGFWPGHTAYADSASEEGPLDLQSAHSCVQQLTDAVATSAQNYTVGPMGNGVHNPILGYYTLGAGMTQATAVGATDFATTNAAGFTCRPFLPTPLPYTAALSDAGHTRWRLVSLSVNMVNKTPEINRGGLVSSVQTSNHFAPTAAALGNRSDFQNFDSYMVHDNDKHVRITWVPRPEDLSFWHDLAITTPTSAVVGIRVWLDAPAGFDQTWEVSIHANWEIAGSVYRAIATPAIQHPKSEELVPQTLAVAKRGQSGANFVTKVGRVMHAAADGAAHMLESAVSGVEQHPLLGIGAGVGALASKILPKGLAASVSDSLGISALEVPLLL